MLLLGKDKPQETILSHGLMHWLIQSKRGVKIRGEYRMQVHIQTVMSRLFNQQS